LSVASGQFLEIYFYLARHKPGFLILPIKLKLGGLSSRSYQNMAAWQKARDLATYCYKFTGNWQLATDH
jgi:hypothetical protein